jgi:hypothetical protein
VDDFDDDETIVDGNFVTPLDLPRCTECGNVVFFDDFTEPANALAFGLFTSDRCVRARDSHWYWCCNTGEAGKYVFFPGKKT